MNCGDAIRIIQKKGKGKTVGNILIDSGYINTYNVLKNGIRDIFDNKAKIDLWVLTHLDADHINGAVKFLRDPEIHESDSIIKELWFNFHDSFRVRRSNGYVSFGKGIKLKNDLK
ncbi:MBL fold metallo-hydrolase [Sphingobacterium sp. MYb388]|uniref:MBL fold metallo-hydrolase n=1 Tax=Sphingobacterium sp. MYb388 TaxID=2745437 RepID=UPI0030A2F842